MKPGTPLLQSTRLLDQVRERIRYMHYSLKTEKAYLYWIRFFIRWSATQGGMRHPRVKTVLPCQHPGGRHLINFIFDSILCTLYVG